MSAQLEIVLECPLGMRGCEWIAENTIHRCRWYRAVVMQNPQTGKEHDEWDCVIPTTLMATLEAARTNRGQTQAIESFRNEMVRGNNKLLGAMMPAIQDFSRVQISHHTAETE